MAQTFRDLIAANKRNSAILVVVFCLFVTTVAMILVAIPVAIILLAFGVIIFDAFFQMPQVASAP